MDGATADDLRRLSMTPADYDPRGIALIWLTGAGHGQAGVALLDFRRRAIGAAWDVALRWAAVPVGRDAQGRDHWDATALITALLNGTMDSQLERPA
jgi:hypothetical protein